MKSKKTALAALRLFKALPKAKAETAANHGKSKQFNDTFIRFGIYVVPEADFSVIDQSARKEILSKYGLSAEQMNQTFHKSFSAVAGASDETLRFQQALHYLTTYGVESLGFKTGEICSVYIPDEKLNLPEDSAGFRINIIGAISADEIREKVKSLSEKNIAFSTVTMEDIILLSKEYDIDLDPDAISCKELRTRVCAELNKVPSDPQEFLRLLNFLVSGDSLLIKSRILLSVLFERSKIKCDDIDKANAALELYVNKYGYVPLASIFYRHKKIWLTIKNKKNASVINRIRRLADKHRKPAGRNILDCVISDPSWDISEAAEELKKVSLGKKVSLLNAMRYRMKYPSSINYRIRNGGVYFKELDSSSRPAVFDMPKADEIMELLYNGIIEQVKEKAAGKTVYIPDYIHYAFPTSEKDFVSGIPCGSVAHLGKTATIGVFWENIPEKGNPAGRTEEIRIDLDLHMSSVDGDFGWDGEYSSNAHKIIFTGDMTDAPVGTGATECFHIGEGIEQAFSFNLNFFNYQPDACPLGYKLIMDSSPADVFNRDYIMDKKTVLAGISMELKNQSQNIGMICNNSEGGMDFIFSNVNTHTGCSNDKDSARKSLFIESMKLQSGSRISLAEILSRAGARVVNTIPEDCEFADLSFQAITPVSIIELIF